MGPAAAGGRRGRQSNPRLGTDSPILRGDALESRERAVPRTHRRKNRTHHPARTIARPSPPAQGAISRLHAGELGGLRQPRSNQRRKRGGGGTVKRVGVGANRCPVQLRPAGRGGVHPRSPTPVLGSQSPQVRPRPRLLVTHAAWPPRNTGTELGRSASAPGPPSLLRGAHAHAAAIEKAHVRRSGRSGAGSEHRCPATGPRPTETPARTWSASATSQHCAAMLAGGHTSHHIDRGTSHRHRRETRHGSWSWVGSERGTCRKKSARHCPRGPCTAPSRPNHKKGKTARSGPPTRHAGRASPPRHERTKHNHTCRVRPRTAREGGRPPLLAARCVCAGGWRVRWVLRLSLAPPSLVTG